MRLAFVVGSTSYSGAEKVLMALARSFSHRGHEIHLMLTEMSPAPVEPGLYCHSVVSVGGSRPVRTVDRIRRIRRLVQEIKPDVAIGFGYHNSLNLAAALVLTKVPTVLTERTNPKHYPPGFLPTILRRIFFGLADACVFQTVEIRDQFIKKVRRRSTIIPNPVIAEVGGEQRPANVGGSPDAKGGRVFSVIAVSRLSEVDKNLSLLIRCFGALAPDFPEWRLDIYGSGPDHELYDRMISELGLEQVVCLLGHTSAPAQAMKSASVYALVSKTEGMPNTLIEAMALGLPCVATDCDGGGARAVMTTGVDGLLVPNGSLAGLGKALRAVMSDASLRESLGTSAQHINDRFSLERVTDAWLGVFDDVRRS